MRNLKAMKSGVHAINAKGFTIIELVVVILLLGILTATALPRFIDVTDDARDAVKEATVGGITTSMAIYRAAVIAGNIQSGQTPSANSDYTLAANANGYPAISQGCGTIYNGLLQSGRTTASLTASTATTCSFVLTDVSRTLTFDVTDGSAI